MSSEIQQAAERLEINICRLRGWLKAAAKNSIFPLVAKDVENLLASLEEYQAQHPADSGTALDESWLRIVGFIKALNGPTRMYSDWLTLKPSVKGAWAAWHWSADSDRSASCLVVLFTRGDLRTLAMALGYEIKEPANGQM